MFLGTVLGELVIAFIALAAATKLVDTKGLKGITIIFQELSNTITVIISLINALADSGLTIANFAIVLTLALGEIVVAFTLLALATKLIDSEGLKGLQIIFDGLVNILKEFVLIIEAISSSSLQFHEVLILLGVVMASILLLVGALIGAVKILTNDPLALVTLVMLTKSITTILITISTILPIILDACSTFITTIAPVVINLLSTIGTVITLIIIALGTTLPPIINSIGTLFTNTFNAIANVINSVGNTISKILTTTKNLVTEVLAAIVTFINELGPAINNFVDGAINAVTKLINFMVSGIEYLINSLIIDSINAVIRSMDAVLSWIGLGNTLKTISRVNIARFTPKLATGGIVDVPKTGINIGGAIVGEAGAEGVLPLTNENTMTRLGKEIGKWITLNVNLTNTIDGRVLNKRLETIKTEQSFAKNGG